MLLCNATVFLPYMCFPKLRVYMIILLLLSDKSRAELIRAGIYFLHRFLPIRAQIFTILCLSVLCLWKSVFLLQRGGGDGIQPERLNAEGEARELLAGG